MSGTCARCGRPGVMPYECPSCDGFGTDRQELPEGGEPTVSVLFVGGGDFILDAPESPAPLWGAGDDVLLSDGESLIIAGAQGLGKTTLAQQLALGRCGFGEYAELLGYPIEPGRGRTLYLALDRPRQAARSFRRMVGEAWRAELNERLSVWQGPPPADLARHPGMLSDLAKKAGADTVIIDSLKDAAVGLSDDEVGSGYNRARQTALADGVQLVELHHPRKQSNVAMKEKARPDIDVLYGSTWVSSGAGSVLLLSGSPGDPVVGLHHVKQPSAEVGPLHVFHDHDAGRSTVWHDGPDAVALASRPDGVSALELAIAANGTDKITPSQKEKARRKLDRLTRDGLLCVISEGDRTTGDPARWGAR